MAASDRPTTEVADVLLNSMDFMIERLMQRLDGLTAEEYLWEPVDGMWSVRDNGQGPVVDGAGVREIDPPPVPTIAWRMWHIAVDCLDDYTRRFAGDLADAPVTWTLDPDDAIARLNSAWSTYRETIAELDFMSPLGPNWMHWSEHCVADMVMHCSNEVVHHGAEIAVLRDLYRDRSA